MRENTEVWPLGTLARIHVADGPSEAWPVVERVPGGWQSGAHHYPDADVLSAEPLAAQGRRLGYVIIHEFEGFRGIYTGLCPEESAARQHLAKHARLSAEAERPGTFSLAEVHAMHLPAEEAKQ